MKGIDGIDIEIGKKIRNFRKNMGINKKEICLLWSISVQQLDKYEKGINRISASNLIKFLDNYKLKFDDFLERKEFNNPLGAENLFYNINKIRNSEVKTSLFELIKNIAKNKIINR